MLNSNNLAYQYTLPLKQSLRSAEDFMNAEGWPFQVWLCSFLIIFNAVRLAHQFSLKMPVDVELGKTLNITLLFERNLLTFIGMKDSFTGAQKD